MLSSSYPPLYHVKENRFFTFQSWAQAFEKVYVIKMSDGIKARPRSQCLKPRVKDKDKKKKKKGNKKC